LLIVSNMIVVLWKNCDVLSVVCKNCGVLVKLQCWTCECCSPGDTHLVDCLALLAAVVLPAPASSSVTKLLVSCVPVYSPSLVWSTP
jgi:hypothetical protein